MELAILFETLDGSHLAPIRLHCESCARLYGPPIDYYRAGATVACIATDVRSGEPQVLAQEVDQEQSWFDFSGVSDAIDGYSYRYFGHS
jgi:hypothetical protein